MDRVTFKTGILLLTVLVSAVYVLRTSNFKSYGSALHSRMLDSVQDTLNSCIGVDISDSFTQTEIDRANSINQYLSEIRGGNQLLTFATSGEDAETFGKDYLIHLIPFAAIGITIFVLSILFICCHCCDYACFRHCTDGGMCNKVLCISLSVIFSMLMIGTAAAGWYFTTGLTSGYQRSNCAITNMIADFSMGSPEQQWVGLSLAISNLTVIKGSITTTVNQLPDPNQLREDLTGPYGDLNQSISNYASDNANQKVADPQTGQATVIPDFIAALGNPSNSSTLSGMLQYEANQKYQTVSSGLNDAASSITSLKNQVSSISNTLGTGISEVSSLNDTITDILQGYTSGSEEGSTINDGLSIGVYVFFITEAVFAGILLLGVINSFTLRSQLGFKILVVVRYIVNVILILCSFVSILIFPVLIVAMEGCDAAQTALKNETIFQGFVNASNLDDSDFSLYASTCFFGDGYIVGDLDISDQLDDMNTIYTQVQDLSAFANFSIPDSFIIPTQELYINLFLSGELPVTTKVGNQLIQLDYLTSTPTATCTSDDIWVLNSTNCTAAYGTKFESSDSPQFNFGQPTCIGFDQYGSSTGTQRYSQQPSCVNNSLIVPGIAGFQNHLSQVRTVFTQVQNSLNEVNTSNAQFMSQIRTAVAPLDTISGNVLTILNMVGNNQTGLLSNLNCSFLQSNSKDAIDNVCVAYLPILFVTSVFILAFAVAALLGLFPIFFAGKIQMAERKRIYENNENNFDEQFLIGPK